MVFDKVTNKYFPSDVTFDVFSFDAGVGFTNGDEAAGVSWPVSGFTLKIVIVLLKSVRTYKNLPSARIWMSALPANPEKDSGVVRMRWRCCCQD